MSSAALDYDQNITFDIITMFTVVNKSLVFTRAIEKVNLHF